MPCLAGEAGLRTGSGGAGFAGNWGRIVTPVVAVVVAEAATVAVWATGMAAAVGKGAASGVAIVRVCVSGTVV